MEQKSFEDVSLDSIDGSGVKKSALKYDKVMKGISGFDNESPFKSGTIVLSKPNKMDLTITVSESLRIPDGVKNIALNHQL